MYYNNNNTIMSMRAASHNTINSLICKHVSSIYYRHYYCIFHASSWSCIFWSSIFRSCIFSAPLPPSPFAGCPFTYWAVVWCGWRPHANPCYAVKWVKLDSCIEWPSAGVWTKRHRLCTVIWRGEVLAAGRDAQCTIDCPPTKKFLWPPYKSTDWLWEQTTSNMSEHSRKSQTLTYTQISLLISLYILSSSYICMAGIHKQESPAHLYLAPPLGVKLSDLSNDPWWRKTRMMGLTDSERISMMRSAILPQSMHVTRRTDGQTELARHIRVIAYMLSHIKTITH